MLRSLFKELDFAQKDLDRFVSKGLPDITDATKVLFGQIVPFFKPGININMEAFTKASPLVDLSEVRFLLTGQSESKVALHVIETNPKGKFSVFDAGIFLYGHRRPPRSIINCPEGEDPQRWLAFQGMRNGLIRFEPDGAIPDFGPQIRKNMELAGLL